MAVIAISTCLPILMHDEIKKRGWKVPELIRLGVLAKKENPQMISRIRELDDINKELIKNLRMCAVRIYKLEHPTHDEKQQTKLGV